MFSTLKKISCDFGTFDFIRMTTELIMKTKFDQLAQRERKNGKEILAKKTIKQPITFHNKNVLLLIAHFNSKRFIGFCMRSDAYYRNYHNLGQRYICSVFY